MATLDKRVATMGQDQFFKHLSRQLGASVDNSYSVNSKSSNSLLSSANTSMRIISYSPENTFKKSPVRVPKVKFTNQDSSVAKN